MYQYAISFHDSFIRTIEWQQAMKTAGIRKIEYSCSRSKTPEEWQADVKQLLLLQEQGLCETASIHIPFAPFNEWTLFCTDEFERKAGVARILEFLKICAPLQTKNYTLHASGEIIADPDRPDVIAAVHRSLEELLPAFAAQKSFLNVELLPRTCIGNSAAEIKNLVAGFPDTLGICMDVNHLCGTPELVPDGISLLTDRIRSFHLSDYDGIDECHWYPGLGVLDWPRIMTAVKMIPQDVLLIFEVTHVDYPAWQKREKPVAPEILFRNCERSAFLLNHAEEFSRRIREETKILCGGFN